MGFNLFLEIWPIPHSIKSHYILDSVLKHEVRVCWTNLEVFNDDDQIILLSAVYSCDFACQISSVPFSPKRGDLEKKSQPHDSNPTLEESVLCIWEMLAVLCVWEIFALDGCWKRREDGFPSVLWSMVPFIHASVDGTLHWCTYRQHCLDSVSYEKRGEEEGGRRREGDGHGSVGKRLRWWGPGWVDKYAYPAFMDGVTKSCLLLGRAYPRVLA